MAGFFLFPFQAPSLPTSTSDVPLKARVSTFWALMGPLSSPSAQENQGLQHTTKGGIDAVEEQSNHL